MRRLLALLLLALAIRLVASAASAVYVDEAYTFFLARAPLGDIVTGARPDLNPPAWPMLLHPLARATSDRVLLRLPSVLCGVGAAGMAFLLGRRLGGERLGLLAAAAAATAYPAWLGEAQFRAYGILTLALVSLVWLLLERPGRTGLLLAACLAAPLFHHLGVAVLGAALLLSLWRRDWPGAGCAAAGLALAGLWLAFALTGASSEIKPGALDPSALGQALRVPAYLSGLLMPLFWTRTPTGPWFVPLEWALSAGLWILALRGARRAPEGPALALLALAPLAGVALGAALGIQPYQHRYLAPVAVPFLLLAALGLPERPRAALAGLLVGVNLVTAFLFARDPYLWNQDWDSVARFVRERERPGDAVVAYVPYSLVGFTFAWDPAGIGWDFSRPGELQALFPAGYQGPLMLGLAPSLLGPDLDRQLQGRRVFLVLNQEDAGGGAIRSWLHPRYGVADALEIPSLHTWGQISVYLLEPLGRGTGGGGAKAPAWMPRTSPAKTSSTSAATRPPATASPPS